MLQVKKIIFIIYLILSVNNVNGHVNEKDLQAVYLLKIADNFSWEISEKPISIGVLSNNHDFLFKLKKYSLNKTISGRNIKVRIASNHKKLSDFDIILVTKEKNKNLEQYVKNIDNNKTLLFTQSAPKMDFPMINFYTSYDKKIKFKINANSLKKHILPPTPIMLILGGSDNDILSLFEKKDSSLLKEINKILLLKIQNKDQEDKLSKLEDEFNYAQKSLNQKQLEILEKSNEIKNITGKLNVQKKFLQKISSKIDATSNALKEKKNQIKNQDSKLTDQLSTFKNQKENISDQQKQIKSQNNILKQQKSILLIKEKHLNYTYLFSFILLGISAFAVISFNGKRNSNKQLAKQNKKLRLTLGELQTAQAKLVQNEKMASLGMVTAGMAHEINNPMTFVYSGVTVLEVELKSYTNFVQEVLSLISSDQAIEKIIDSINKLKMDYEFEETHESIDQTIIDIKLGAKRITEIVESLQSFSRLHEDNVKKVNINQSLNSTLTILGSHARKKNVNIKTNLDKNLFEIECFPASINQVFVNVISNAIDATPNNTGNIRILTQKLKDHCLIQISDNGVGIEKKNIDKIFDPFFTTKEIGKGTGLGLSISYNIVKKHNGNITVNSTLNKETTFKIELPLVYFK